MVLPLMLLDLVPQVMPMASRVLLLLLVLRGQGLAFHLPLLTELLAGLQVVGIEVMDDVEGRGRIGVGGGRMYDA